MTEEDKKGGSYFIDEKGNKTLVFRTQEKEELKQDGKADTQKSGTRKD